MSRLPAAEDYVRLFTDGACSGNPGPGGWAFILEHPASGKVLERFGAEPHTTNNRMEIEGALRGLETLKRPCRVELVTDSQYLAKGINEWLPGWRANGYRRREGNKLKPLQNDDLWRAVDTMLAKHQIRVVHVKGHAGHPQNERCDQLAVAAYKALGRRQQSKPYSGIPTRETDRPTASAVRPETSPQESPLPTPSMSEALEFEPPTPPTPSNVDTPLPSLPEPIDSPAIETPSPKKKAVRTSPTKSARPRKASAAAEKKEEPALSLPEPVTKPSLPDTPIQTSPEPRKPRKAAPKKRAPKRVARKSPEPVDDLPEDGPSRWDPDDMD